MEQMFSSDLPEQSKVFLKEAREQFRSIIEDAKVSLTYQPAFGHKIHSTCQVYLNALFATKDNPVFKQAMDNQDMTAKYDVASKELQFSSINLDLARYLDEFSLQAAYYASNPSITIFNRNKLLKIMLGVAKDVEEYLKLFSTALPKETEYITHEFQ